MKNRIKTLLKEYNNNQMSMYDEIYDLPYEVRTQLKDQLKTLIHSNESVELAEIDYGGIPELKSSGGIFSNISKWFKRYLTDEASNFLINASADEMKDTIQMLNVLDPNDMQGIFTPRAIYLGGGIDFAKDALSWRTKVDEEFQALFNAWKSNELDDEQFKQFREKIREQIVVQDLYMLKVCDTNLINFDGTAGAGTFGEAQISALKNSQVFIWLTNGMKISNISPWMMPSITKILQEDELWPFLSHFK